MGGTAQGDQNMLTAGQDIARVFGAMEQRQLVGAQQGLTLTDQLPDDDPNRIKAVNAYNAAAQRYYGRRNFPGVPTEQVGGQPVPGTGAPAQSGENPQTPDAYRNPAPTMPGQPQQPAPQGRTAPTPQQTTPTQTIPVVPHVNKVMTFKELKSTMGWDKDGTLTDANGKPIDTTQWDNLPAQQVIDINKGLQRTVTDPVTGEITTQGGLFPNLGPKSDKLSGIMAQAQRFTEAARQAWSTNDQAGLTDVLTRGSAWAKSLIQRDPSLANVLPNFDQLRTDYGTQTSNSQKRIDIESFRTDMSEAWQELRSAQQTGDRASIVNAYKNLQGVIQRGKQLGQPVLAGDQTPEQQADAFLNGPKGVVKPTTGQPIVDSQGNTWVPETTQQGPDKAPTTRWHNVTGGYYADSPPTQAADVGTVTDSDGNTWHILQYNRPNGAAPDVRYYNPKTNDIRPTPPAGAEPRLPAKPPVDKNGFGKMSENDIQTWINQNGPWARLTTKPVTSKEINDYHDAVAARDQMFGLNGHGDQVFEKYPELLLDAIRAAEGNSSYGYMPAIKQYGKANNVPDAVGRAGARQTVKDQYTNWVHAGRPGDFLGYLSDRYEGEGGPNGANWLTNVLDYLRSHPPGSQQPVK